MILHRIAIAITTLALLGGCEVEPPQLTGEELVARRVAQGLEVIDACRTSECARIDLDSRFVRDYTIVADMTHVTAFMASYSDFANLDDIAAMSQLRELHLGATRVTDLGGLSNFPNLTLLHLQQSDDITDFSAIGQLSNLQELALGSNNVGDLSFLRGTNSLTMLNLEYASIDSLRGLRRHPTLESLDLVGSSLPDDLSVLKTIPNLKTVSFNGVPLSDSQRVVVDELRARGVEILTVVTFVAC